MRAQSFECALPADEQQQPRHLRTVIAPRECAAKRQEELRKVADAEWKKAVEAWKKPQYYTVRRGDALGSIATMWNTSMEKLQKLNNMPGIGIRVGQTLLVREAID